MGGESERRAPDPLMGSVILAPVQRLVCVCLKPELNHHTGGNSPCTMHMIMDPESQEARRECFSMRLYEIAKHLIAIIIIAIIRGIRIWVTHNQQISRYRPHHFIFISLPL